MSVDLICFPLPDGRSGAVGRCSVLFAPRMRTAGALSTFSDWVDWPSTVNGLGIQARVDGAIVPSSRTSGPASSAMWAAIFPPATPVTEHVGVDRSGSDLVDYAAGSLIDSVGTALAGIVGARPDGVASVADLASVPGMADLFTSGLLDDVEAYHGTVGDTSSPPAGPDTPDFHTWLTLLAAHPALLRRLGLVVDLQLDLTGIPNPSTLQIETNYSALGATRRAVHMTMRVEGSLRATSDPDPIRKEVELGWLRCADDSYRFAQDGDDVLARQLGQLQRQDGGAGDEPGTGAFPAPQSTGMVLVRNNSAAKLAARFARQVQIEDEIRDVLQGTKATVSLWAEDVVVGYRFDIWDDTTGDWHSLHRRTPTGPYELPRNTSISYTPPPDEDVQVLTLSAEGNESSTIVRRTIGEVDQVYDQRSGALRSPPNLVTWYGWSKAARAPRKVFDPSTGAAVEVSKPGPGTDVVRLAIDHAATPGTLPRLRYGWTYQIRARAVDVAGNSVAPPPAGTPPTVALSEQAPFGRGVLPPPVVLRNVDPPVPGAFESAVSIVLRSDYDVDDGDVAPDERVVFPPPTNQYTCELHGLPAGGIDPASYGLLAARDGASLDDVGDRTPDGELVWGTYAGEAFTPADPAATVPYLPDPPGVSLCIFGAPGGTGALLVPWDGAWPDRQGGRLVVAAGDAAPSVRPAADVLARVSVPKAVRAVLDLSLGVDPAMVEHFRLWHLIDAGDTATQGLVGDGRHAMFSSRVRVELVHAVRRPLAAPVPGALVAEREGPGATRARVVGPVTIDGASTGSLRVRATWTETVDDPSDPSGPQPVARAARASRDTRTGADDIEAAHVLALATTKRAELSLELDAISAFVDYFLEQADVPLAEAGATLDPAGVVASTVRVQGPGGPLRQGIDWGLDADAGTIARQPASTHPDGDVVTVQYVARPVLRESTELGAPGTVKALALATVAPPPPEGVELVPASTTRTRSTSERIDVLRRGSVVRVWMDRPWLVSGDGERLAVLYTPAGGAVTERSAIARHPAAFGGGPADPLGDDSFASASEVRGPVDGGLDALAVHEVRYDADRRRWSADVELRGELGYRPWVRLMLVRYQADAIEGAKLSPDVTPDPIRLGPSRQISVRRVGRRIGVLVLGEDHDGVPDGSGGRLYNEVTVTLQEADPTIADPDLRWVDTEVSTVLDRPRAGRWNGVLSPGTAATGGQPLRLVITETEPVPAHDGVGVERPVVFVEVVDVPPEWLPRTPVPPGQPD